MATVTIFGKGSMGEAIGSNFVDAGNEVKFVASSESDKVNSIGEIVVLAVPYPAVEGILATYADELDGKTIIDITNPVNFDTFDDLVVLADSSAAEVISNKVGTDKVVKGFNTTFASTLATKQVASEHQTTVILTSDDSEAKQQVTDALDGSGLAVIDAGSLKRARELEALGFLQISLAAAEKISCGDDIRFCNFNFLASKYEEKE